MILLLLTGIGFAFAGEIKTNAISIHRSPGWLNAPRVERVVDQIQNLLEWDIRRAQAYWYSSAAEFRKAHGLGSSVLAFARKQDNSVHIGPEVTPANFDSVFGHELTHVVIYQKYKDSIPKWLDEGLANYAAKHGAVDYVWLASQPVRDIESLSHPFAGLSSQGGETGLPRYHYMASTATMEMIAAKCRLSDLLQLSVGKKLKTYLSTYCGIQDLNAELKKWIAGKAALRSGQKAN